MDMKATDKEKKRLLKQFTNNTVVIRYMIILLQNSDIAHKTVGRSDKDTDCIDIDLAFNKKFYM